jgi:hypothetical protein
MDGRGVRCVSDRPWITAAETCECVMAHLGRRRDLFGETAERLFYDEVGAASTAVDDGRYWTGIVYPDEVTSRAASSRPTPPPR